VSPIVRASRGARCRAPIFFLFAFLTMSAPDAAAQQQPPADAGPPAAAAKPEATPAGQPLSAERRAAIEKLLAASGSIAQGRRSAERSAAQALEALDKARQGINPRAIELTKEVFGQELTRFIESPDGVTPLLVNVYARHYTHDEILGLIAFYETDLGRKVARTMPLLMEEITAAVQKHFQHAMPRLLRTLAIRFKEEGIVP
jgi:uncharacterized protein